MLRHNEFSLAVAHPSVPADLAITLYIIWICISNTWWLLVCSSETGLILRRFVWGTVALHQANCQSPVSRTMASCDIARKIDGARRWTHVSEYVRDPDLSSENAAFALYRLGTLTSLMTISDFSGKSHSHSCLTCPVHSLQGSHVADS